jgi:competence protein ComEA
VNRLPRGALSRLTSRVIGSRFAKPVARVVLVAMGLVLLAVIGRTSVAGTFGAPPAVAVVSADAGADPASTASDAFATETYVPPATPSPSAVHGPASADDPVVLNTAEVSDLRRLPGIGEKRASAILALRERLGRFRAIEDLLKVKGIGRAMLKRLRPLVRLDGPTGDAGVASR